MGRFGRLATAALLAVLAAFVGAGEVQAQGYAGPSGGGPSGPTSGTTGGAGLAAAKRVPGTAIRFSQANPKGGWFLLMPGVKGRWVHDFGPWSGHPTIELIIEAGLSGHPTLDERMLVQFPPNLWQIPLSQRAIVVAFHPYGLSYVSPFNGSLLPAICEQRDWILLAPLGLTQTNFATVQSQETLDITMGIIAKFLPYNRQMVYTVGFSMGGMNAVSYAMRKQDPKGLRVAGVINHTGTMDAILDYETGAQALKDILENDDHFGGSPTEQPFAWERVNPAKLDASNIVDAQRAPVTNLVDVPFYLHVNKDDPQTDLVDMTYALYDHLLSLGVDVVLSEVSAGATHHWNTMDMTAAINHIAGAVAPGVAPENGPVLELFADREAGYRLTEVLAIEPETVARYKIVVQTPIVNAFAVQGIDGVRELAVDLGPLLADPSELLTITTWNVDSKPTTLVLEGYTAAPATILVNGVPPIASSFDPAAGTLSVQPTSDGSFAVVQIIP